MQIDELKLAKCQQIFQEKISSGKERPQLLKMLEMLREGDTVVVYKLDRLGRSLRELVNPIAQFEERKIAFVSLKDAIDTSTARGRFFLNIFASLAEFDRIGEPKGYHSGAYEGRAFSCQSNGTNGWEKERIEPGCHQKSGNSCDAIQGKENCRRNSEHHWCRTYHGLPLPGSNWSKKSIISPRNGRQYFISSEIKSTNFKLLLFYFNCGKASIIRADSKKSAIRCIVAFKEIIISYLRTNYFALVVALNPRLLQK